MLEAQKTLEIIMKTLLMLLTFSSFSTFASCYLTTNSVGYTQIPTKICLKDVYVDIKPFGETVLTATLNEKPIKRKITEGKEIQNGYKIKFDLLTSEHGGFCGERYGYKTSATVTITNSGELTTIESIQGYAFYTEDDCHSPIRRTYLDYLMD